MIKEYKIEVLRNLGVYELRELARNIGVSSPTTKKRKQLEQEILKISKGEIIPAGKQTNKGRPPKSIKKVENVLDIFVPKELLELTLNKKIDTQLEGLLKLSANSLNDDELYKQAGYLRKTVSGYYYFKNYGINEECVSVPNNFVENYNLMEGDRVDGFARKSLTDNFFVLHQINLINGATPEESRILKKGEPTLADLPLKGVKDVYEGNNILFVTSEVKQGIEGLKNALAELDKDYKVVILATSISTYTKLYLEKVFKAEILHTLVEDHPAYAYENALNAANHVNMLVKEGKKVVFVCFDMFSLVNEIETFFALENQKKSHQENIEAIRIAKKLLTMGKVLDTDASVTVFATCIEQETQTEVFATQFTKLFDKTIKI